MFMRDGKQVVACLASVVMEGEGERVLCLGQRAEDTVVLVFLSVQTAGAVQIIYELENIAVVQSQEFLTDLMVRRDSVPQAYAVRQKQVHDWIPEGAARAHGLTTC